MVLDRKVGNRCQEKLQGAGFNVVGLGTEG